MYAKILIGLYLIVSVNNCLAQDISSEQEIESQNFQKLFPVNINFATFDIDEGNVEINAHNENFAKILYTPHFKECVIKIDVIDSQLCIVNNKKEHGCKCDYKIYLPQNVEVITNLGAGTINVHDLESKLQLNLGAVKVGIFNTAGNIDLNMGTGSIKYNPARSSDIQILNINYGSAELDCIFPKDTIVKSMPKNNFMIKVDSAVNFSDKNYNYEIKGSMGVGLVKLSYE